MEGVGAAIEAGANAIGTVAKTTESLGGAFEAGAEISSTAVSGAAEAASAATPIAEGITESAKIAGSVVDNIQDGSSALQSAASETVTAAAEPLGNVVSTPIDVASNTFGESLGSMPEASAPILSPGELAAQRATELSQAQRVYTEGMRADTANPADAQRITQLRNEIDELRLQQMQSRRSNAKEGDEKEEPEEEIEVVKRGNKTVIRRKKPGIKRMLGDTVADLSAEITNDAGIK